MLTPLDHSEAHALREFLNDSGYTDPEFRRRRELDALPSSRAGNISWLLEATDTATAQNLLLRLFLFGVPQPIGNLRAIAPDSIVNSLFESGLLALQDGAVHPAAMLAPVDSHVFAADTIGKLESEDSSDVVVWPNPTTRMLQAFAVQSHSKRTLDLGAGCGVMAVTASRWSDLVVATDLNARAAEFTQFNAALNGVTNIENRTGDTYDPVNGNEFDLILANPPFFVTPASGLLFCENPMELDGYCRRVVREGAGLLSEGGFLQMVCEWVQVKGQPWQERLAEWVDGLDCDAWVVRTYAAAPAAYAWQRVQSGHTPGSSSDAEQFQRLIEYYRRRDVEGVQGGVLAIRRRSGENWLRIEEGKLESMASFGSQVQGVFRNQDLLSGPRSEERLLAARPRLADGVHIDQRLELEAGDWVRSSMTIVGPGVLASSLSVEPPVADFLKRCDGASTLEDLVRQTAQHAKAPIEVVRPQVCAAVRKAAERRILWL